MVFSDKGDWKQVDADWLKSRAPWLIDAVRVNTKNCSAARDGKNSLYKRKLFYVAKKNWLLFTNFTLVGVFVYANYIFNLYSIWYLLQFFVFTFAASTNWKSVCSALQPISVGLFQRRFYLKIPRRFALLAHSSFILDEC